MLARAARLTRRREFELVVRRGRRAARGTVVVHLLRAGLAGGPRVGFVVSKAVGGSVDRHRVQRRLRHLMRERLPELPADAWVVLRARRRAASATSAELGRDVDAALPRLVREVYRG